MTHSLAKPAALLFGLLTPTGLRPLPHAWTRREDVAFGSALRGVGEALPWAVGDWILAMEAKYGESYAQLAHEAGINPHTAQNVARVCERFPKSRRRELPVSFGHHDAVANLEPRDQEVLLDQATTKGWSVMTLRVEARTRKRGESALDPCARHVCRRCGVIWDGNHPV